MDSRFLHLEMPFQSLPLVPFSLMGALLLVPEVSRAMAPPLPFHLASRAFLGLPALCSYAVGLLPWQWVEADTPRLPPASRCSAGWHRVPPLSGCPASPPASPSHGEVSTIHQIAHSHV